MKPLEIVKPDREERSHERGRPAGSFGAFVGSVLAVIALAFMLALGFFVADIREDAKLLDLKVQKLQNDLSYLRGQIERKDGNP